MTFNDITFSISIFFLPFWLIWELVVLLWLRPRGVSADRHLVGTISMVMQQRAYIWNFIPFFWGGMLAHWWINWMRTATWSSPFPMILFWLILAGTAGLDFYLWHSNVGYASLPEWAKVLRAPAVQAILGLVLAYILFPQKALGSAGFRWW